MMFRMVSVVTTVAAILLVVAEVQAFQPPYVARALSTMGTPLEMSLESYPTVVAPYEQFHRHRYHHQLQLHQHSHQNDSDHEPLQQQLQQQQQSEVVLSSFSSPSTTTTTTTTTKAFPSASLLAAMTVFVLTMTSTSTLLPTDTGYATAAAAAAAVPTNVPTGALVKKYSPSKAINTETSPKAVATAVKVATKENIPNEKKALLKAQSDLGFANEQLVLAKKDVQTSQQALLNAEKVEKNAASVVKSTKAAYIAANDKLVQLSKDKSTTNVMKQTQQTKVISLKKDADQAAETFKSLSNERRNAQKAYEQSAKVAARAADFQIKCTNQVKSAQGEFQKYQEKQKALSKKRQEEEKKRKAIETKKAKDDAIALKKKQDAAAALAKQKAAEQAELRKKQILETKKKIAAIEKRQKDVQSQEKMTQKQIAETAAKLAAERQQLQQLQQ
jgi:hypothetical protein